MRIEDVIHTAGYRATPQRHEFLEILEKERFMDIDVLKNAFMERSHANLATFYRVLTDFRASGFVHTITENNHEFVCLCEEIRQNKVPSHSYELVHCHSCGDIQDHHDDLATVDTLSSRREIHVGKCQTCKSI